MDGDGWIFLAIIGWVVGAAWLSRYVALDMDARGKAGWPYGLTTLIIPPLGVAFWLLDRNRPATRNEMKPKLGGAADILFFIVVLVTFPWGFIIWVLLNRRARPTS